MQSLVLLSVLISMATGNMFDRFLYNMALRNSDPFTRSLLQSSLGSELFDIDIGSNSNNRGSSSSSGFGSPFGMGPGPSRSGTQSMFANMVSQPSSFPSFPSSSMNQVAPSSLNPTKANNPYESLLGTSGPSSGAKTLTSSQAVPVRMPVWGMSQPTSSGSMGGGSNFFQNFMALRALEWLDFF